MMKKSKNSRVYSIYSSSYDITFIIEDRWSRKTGELLSTTCKGFYYGTPNETDTREFYGRLTAKYRPIRKSFTKRVADWLKKDKKSIVDETKTKN
jgi:hypothetical protein